MTDTKTAQSQNSSHELIDQARTLLAQIPHPNQEGNVISTGCVDDLRIEGDQVFLTLSFKDALPRDVRHELEDKIYDALVSLEGVDDVEIEVEVPNHSTPSASSTAVEPGLTQYGSASSSKSSENEALNMGAPAPKGISEVKHLIAVGSGKGGVGKSTVAANLALSLKEMGARVGLCDIDMYGPSAPILFGVTGAKVKTDADKKRFVPVEAYGIKVMSIGFLIDEETPVIWRGPIVGSIVKQFLEDTAWGELDYLIIDLPPGTGDAQLTLTQSASITGALMVTTPSELSVSDAIKGMQMFRKVDIPILGVVENMSYYVCGACGHESTPFNQGGTERMCVNFGTQVIARLPLHDETQRGGDEGRPVVISHPESAQTKAFHELAGEIAQKLPFKQEATPEKVKGLLSSIFKR